MVEHLKLKCQAPQVGVLNNLSHEQHVFTFALMSGAITNTKLAYPLPNNSTRRIS
jgi:hypothetical protein